MAKVNLANTQDIVEIEEIRESAVLLKDGGLRQILMVGGINFSLKSEQEQNLITQAYQNFLNGLNFPLQIIIHSRKINIEHYLSSLDERKAQEQSGLLQDQIAEYQEFIRRFVQENAIMSKTFFIVVPFYPIGSAAPSKQKVLSFLPFLKKKQGAEAAKQEAVSRDAAFKENLTQLAQRVAQVMDGLATVGLETVILNDEQLVELFYNFYNPETVEKEKAHAERQ